MGAQHWEACMKKSFWKVGKEELRCCLDLLPFLGLPEYESQLRTRSRAGRRAQMELKKNECRTLWWRAKARRKHFEKWKWSTILTHGHTNLSILTSGAKKGAAQSDGVQIPKQVPGCSGGMAPTSKKNIEKNANVKKRNKKSRWSGS